MIEESLRSELVPLPPLRPAFVMGPQFVQSDAALPSRVIKSRRFIAAALTLGLRGV